MKPEFRKLSLMAHILVSVGWLGAVVAYLALAIVGLTSQDAPTSRAVYISMEIIGWFVIVPFGVATLVAGLIESLGTPWGLFRHWWVLVKFVLTTTAVTVLILHMPTVSRMSTMARGTAFFGTDSVELRTQLLIHASGGLLILLVATALSIYKPWGLTPYGARKRRGLPRNAAADSVSNDHRDKLAVDAPFNRAPSWALVVGFHAMGLAMLFVVVHLARGSAWGH